MEADRERVGGPLEVEAAGLVIEADPPVVLQREGFKQVCQLHSGKMETLKILGERLRDLRKEKDRLRQVDMAEFLGVTQAHYQRIEKGKINIPTLTLCALADYFGVTTDYLLGRSDER